MRTASWPRGCRVLLLLMLTSTSLVGVPGCSLRRAIMPPCPQPSEAALAEAAGVARDYPHHWQHDLAIELYCP